MSDTATLVHQAVRDGILHAVRPMNGDPELSQDYATGDVYIGQGTEPGERVYVDVRISHVVGREVQTTDHRTVSDYWSLSISGATSTPASRRRNDIDTGGQIRETVATVTSPLPVAEFVKVWERHHLADMQAGCDHQTPVMEERYGQQVPSLDLTPACPETGYRYGHAWLQRDVPPQAISTVLDFLSKARDISTSEPLTPRPRSLSPVQRASRKLSR